MTSPRSAHSHLRWILAIAILVCGGRSVVGYTPESPKVQKMVRDAAEYLEEADRVRLGSSCLAGLALYKAGKDKDHKVIRHSLEWCRRIITPDRVLNIGGEAAYEYPLACIFMCEVSPDEHRKEIEMIVDATIRSQREYGAWGYLGRTKGDTSQVQYCILALWTARKIGVQVPDSVFVKCCNWILRSQAPRGYWPYQPNDSGAVGKRVAQDDKGHNATYHSTTAAGLGTAYICAEALEIQGLGGRIRPGVIRKIPAVFKRVENENFSRDSSVNHAFLNQALQDGNTWFDDKFVINPMPAFPHYYRYAFERYQSFREKVEKQNEPDNAWYDEGVEFLASVQTEHGGFEDGEAKHFPVNVLNSAVTTSFAVLFLTRGTQQSLGTLTQGSLKGQKGLPSNASDIRMRNGRIMTTPISRSVGDLLGMLEGPDGKAELDDLINSELDLKFDTDDSSRAKNAARLRSLVSHRSYKARLLAVRAMARSRDVNSVPALIYSLSDPDWRVVLAANDGLKSMSRQFDGYDLPTDKADPALAKQLAAKWRQWFASINPTQ